MRIVARYGPGIVDFTQRNGFHGLGGTIGVMDILFGKPQSWYNELGSLQNKLAGQMAEITAFGRGIWDTIAGVAGPAAKSGKIPGLSYFPGYDWITGEIDAKLKGVLVSTAHAPSDSEISGAQNRIYQFRSIIDYAKGKAPELRAQVEQAKREMDYALSKTKLRSPADVGKETFVAEVEKRAKAIGIGGVSIALLAAGAAALFFFGGRRKYQDNPGGGLLLPLAIAGGAAYYFLSKKPSRPLTTSEKAQLRIEELAKQYGARLGISPAMALAMAREAMKKKDQTISRTDTSVFV